MMTIATDAPTREPAAMQMQRSQVHTPSLAAACVVVPQRSEAHAAWTRRALSYSGFTPASLRIFAHFAISDLRYAANCSGVFGLGSMP